MRILMVSHGYPPVLSGVTLVVQKLARAMVRKGHAVTVVTSSDRKEPYRSEDQGVDLVHVHSAHNPWWNRAPIPFLSRKELDSLLEEIQPHVIHAHDAGLLGLQLARYSDDVPLPLMATCHFVPRFVTRYLTWDGEPHEAIESMTWAYSLWLYNHFDHLVFATKTHHQVFAEKGLEVPVTIISNGLDITRYFPANGHDRSEIEAIYNLPKGPRILFVGRLMVDKEIDVLIRALGHMRLKVKAHLLVVGRGDDQERLQGIADELNLTDQVHFLGYVPEEHMPALYQTVDCFAIASQCEVQSLPTLQALATALPVVAADAMALPELVHHGKNGFLVAPEDALALGNALLRVLTEPDLAKRMGQESLSIVQAHAETRTFDCYDALYSDLTS